MHGTQSYHSALTKWDANDENHTGTSVITRTSRVLPAQEEQRVDLFPPLRAGRPFLGDRGTYLKLKKDAVNLISSYIDDQDDWRRQRTTPGTTGSKKETSNDQDPPEE